MSAVTLCRRTLNPRWSLITVLIQNIMQQGLLLRIKHGPRENVWSCEFQRVGRNNCSSWLLFTVFLSEIVWLFVYKFYWLIDIIILVTVLWVCVLYIYVCRSDSRVRSVQLAERSTSVRRLVAEMRFAVFHSESPIRTELTHTTTPPMCDCLCIMCVNDENIYGWNLPRKNWRDGATNVVKIV